MSTTPEPQLLGATEAVADSSLMLALASAPQVRERLAAIVDLGAAIKTWELEQIHKKLDEQGRVLNQVVRTNNNAALLNKAALACVFLATGIAVGLSIGKTWPVMMAWVTQLFV